MPVKRARTSSPIARGRLARDVRHRTGLEDATSHSARSPQELADLPQHQEIFLRILSFLSATDLVNVQGVNKYWSRMSLDPQLWKRLYLSRYPHPHHSKLIYRTDAVSGSSTPSRQRPIARLPSRAFPPPSPSRSPSVSSNREPSSPADVGLGEAPARRLGGIGRATPMSGRDPAQQTEGHDMEIGSGVRNDGVDWKMMLRLGTNWSNGNASSQTSIPLPPSPSPSLSGLSDAATAGPSRPSRPPPYSEQHIALFPSFIFTSNPTSPLVHVHPASSTSVSAAPLGIIPPPPGWSSPSRPDNVTAICADQAVSLPEDGFDTSGDGKPHLPARLAVFYESGGFVVLRVRMTGHASSSARMSWVREAISPAQYRPRSLRRRATTYTPLEGDPVVLATMHFPVLLTCSLAFHLSVYSLPGPQSAGMPSRPRHLQTLHSDVSFHPAALSLFPSSLEGGSSADVQLSSSASPNMRQFRAGLTYCTPLYPSSWAVAVQEFGIDLYADPASQALGSGIGGDVWRGNSWHVGRGDEEDDHLAWPRRVRPIVGVKGSRAVGIGTDGRWCVLAGGDNQIQVYSLPTPSPSPPPSSRGVAKHSTAEGNSTSPIVHAQTLLAHSAAVTSLSLSAGRCVSGGRDGRVLVWDLDEESDEPTERVGRTVGFVEVRPGGRRQTWRGAAGPQPSLASVSMREEKRVDDALKSPESFDLPHPQSISSAARSLFLPRPPGLARLKAEDVRPAIRQLAFDEEKIVGLVNEGEGETREVMKVWSFNG